MPKPKIYILYFYQTGLVGKFCICYSDSPGAAIGL